MHQVALEPGMTVLSASTGAEPEQAAEVVEPGFASVSPNPFNPLPRLRFGLVEAGWTRLTIYNLRGQQVAALVDGELPAGYHEREWAARRPRPLARERTVRGALGDSWAGVHAAAEPSEVNRDEMLCLAIGPESVPEGGSAAAFGDYSVLPGAERILIFDITTLARAWLADPGATRDIALKGCDAVSDVCVLRAVSHGGVSAKLVVGFWPR